eukprot:GHVQ01012378.1.p3 GENE.GHVQ01012378.1~~GHVQ01012378.1.p3  ORF type:complete len:534 (-),score=121.70 GHVQ01012378.1:2857-4458(-)
MVGGTAKRRVSQRRKSKDNFQESVESDLAALDDADGEEAESEESDGYDEDGNDGLGEEEDDEEESSCEEEDVGIGKALPKRLTRGTRMVAMVGDSAEKDKEFWSHDTWEEEEDGEYRCSEGEEQYKDVVDTDFDKEESDEEEKEESGDDEKRVKKKSVYVDPNIVKKKARAKATAAAATKKKVGGSVRAPPKRKRSHTAIDDELSLADVAMICPPRARRATTQRRTEAVAAEVKAREVKRQEQSLKIAAAKRRRAKSKGGVSDDTGVGAWSGIKRYREPTREEHLAEVKITEEQNALSLKNLQAWENERKLYLEYKKQSYKGHYECYITWASDRLINTVDNTVEEKENDIIGESKEDDVEEKQNLTDSIPNGKRKPETETGAGSTTGDLKIPKKRKRGIEEVVDSFDAAVSQKTETKDKSGKEEDTVEDEGDDEPEIICEEQLFFTDGKLPEMYTAPPPVKHKPPICIASGLPAKYRDPLTRLPYANREGFKMIRQWYHDAIDRRMGMQVEYIERLLTHQASICYDVAHAPNV